MKEESTCVPEMCDEITAMNDDASVEYMYCINLIKQNRPESPYQMIDGCIDCHIAAMADALDKALETNVTPMENTTGSFAISSRWGPNFSFNLTTALKSKLKLLFKKPEDPTKKVQEAIDKQKADSKPAETNVPSQESGQEAMSRVLEEEAEQTEAVLKELKNYRNSGSVISDQEVFSRVTPLLEQMRASFERLHGKYSMIVGSIELNKKPQCEF